MRHALVTPKAYFEDVITGALTADIKKDDRPYKKGDTIILQEFDEETQLYTGREVNLTITSLVRDNPRGGLRRGFVFMCFSSDTVVQWELPEGYGKSAKPEASTGDSDDNIPVIESKDQIPAWMKEGDNGQGQGETSTNEPAANGKGTSKKGGK